MANIEFGCRPTIIGSISQNDPVEACTLISHYLKDFPAWPQLPSRSFLENMYVQFSQGFPGIVIEGVIDKGLSGNERFYIDRTKTLSKSIEKINSASPGISSNEFMITKEYAAGLYQFLSLPFLSAIAVKGQITGPISWALGVTDQEHKSIIYDDTLSRIVAKILCLKASWQEKELSKLNKNTIMFIDEPYLSSPGSALLPVAKEKVISLLEETLRGISGIRGIHCCGNLDWSIVLGIDFDIISFDAFNYAESIIVNQKEVEKFLLRSGTIGWGIIPTVTESLKQETVASLKDRLGEIMAPFSKHGIPFRQIVAQSLLTPSCGLTTLNNKDETEYALGLLTGLSEVFRKRYI
jgi:methionine synthase II (cobalamin-independent)